MRNPLEELVVIVSIQAHAHRNRAFQLWYKKYVHAFGVVVRVMDSDLVAAVNPEQVKANELLINLHKLGEAMGNFFPWAEYRDEEEKCTYSELRFLTIGNKPQKQPEQTLPPS